MKRNGTGFSDLSLISAVLVIGGVFSLFRSLQEKEKERKREGNRMEKNDIWCNVKGSVCSMRCNSGKWNVTYICGFGDRRCFLSFSLFAKERKG